MKMRALLLFAVLSQPVTSFAQNLVVWDFATRDGKKTEFTASLTDEFEEALSESRAYVVLERRNFDRLQAVIENEKALQSVSQITPAVSREFKQMGVSVVVFGEVFDDVMSGEISIAVTFQDFTGEKLLMKSVLMRRGLALDASSRREKMRDLVRVISSAVKPPEEEVPAQAHLARLIFRILPEDALVYIDGKHAGMAKGLGKDRQGVVVDPGSRSIGIGRTGYTSLRRDVTLAPGETITIQEALVPEEPIDEEDEEENERRKTGRPCIDNFSREGSFSKGKLLKSWQTFTLEKSVIFKRIAQSVAVNGWFDIRANEELGVITALNSETIGGQGARLPLNIVVESGEDGKVRVEAVFTINPFQIGSVAAVQNGFCKLLEYAE